jgi:hypothetical protein
MNLRTIALIAVAVWTPLLADADAAPEIKRDLRAVKCLSESQILSDLGRKGYVQTRRAVKRTLKTLEVAALRDSKLVILNVDRCTGKILSVQAAREAARQMPSAEPLRKTPKLTLKCLSKRAVYQKLKDRGYNYLKPEQITGPFDSSQGKVYRAQTLVKAGQWCQVKITVSCYNAKLLDYKTIQESCVY